MENKKGKVMLIDDNEIDLKINSKIISLTNLFDEIILCQSGEKGIDYLKKHMNQSNKLPEYILLDIQMPEMDGFEFLEIYENLNINLNCQIIMLSSTLDYGDIKKAEANQLVLKLLKKPLYPKELGEILQNKNLQKF